MLSGMVGDVIELFSGWWYLYVVELFLVLMVVVWLCYIDS